MQKVSLNLAQIIQIKKHWLISPSVQRSMLMVCIALIPGVFTSAYIFGLGMLKNIGLAILFGLLIELSLYRLRNNTSLSKFNFDGSGLVLATVLALSLPPSLPWWIMLIGLFFAIGIGKYAYGGTGHNVFNPAMVGLAALLLSFPVQMSQWQMQFDGLSSATPLDILQTQLHMSQMLSELSSEKNFGTFGATGHEWINFAFLIGGLLLIQQKVIRWQIPAGIVVGIILISCYFKIIDGEIYTGALFNLFSGATMLCAFFVATDPVTSPMTSKGKFIYGFLIGVVIYAIRTWGSYPEGVAFAVLLMNASVPVLDHYTRPKSPV